MGTAVGDLVATLGMNTSPWSSAIAGARNMLAQFKSDAASGISQLKNTMSNLGGGIGLGGILAGGSLALGMNKAIELAGVQQQAEKKLQAVLRSTGEAAGFSAKELFDYASQLQAVTNFGDEATISAMSVMATFTQIRGDVFKDAIAAAQDLSTIMGQDLQSSIVQIGKALNDPIKGVTALQRVGVSFTQQQKEQIKNYVAQGDLVSAQRMILAELGTEFGGSAKALASPITQAKNAIGDLGERIGTFLKPAFVTLWQAANATLTRIVDGVEALWNRFSGLRQTISELWARVSQNPLVQGLLTAVPIVGIVTVAVGALLPLLANIGTVLGVVFTVATGPVGLLVAAIGLLGAALLYVGVEGETMADKLQNVFQWIGETIDTIAFTFRNFGAIARMTVNNLLLWFLDVFPSMEGPVRAVGEVFVGTWAGCKAFFSAVIDNMLAGLREIANAAKALGTGIAAAWEQIKSGNFSGVGSAFGDAFMKEFTKQADEKAPNAMQAFKDAYKTAAGAFDQGVTDSGGMKKWLEDQNKAFANGVAQNETAFKAREFKKKEEEAGGGKRPFAMPNVGPQDKAKTQAKDEMQGILEKGSDEAWKKIVSVSYGLDDKDKAAEDTAANTAKTNELLKGMSDKLEEASI